MVGQLVGVLAVALLLLFFILAAQFESLVQPWIILSEIVIDLFGAILVLRLFGESLNLMSMIGLIVVCGIVINDSILKIDTINTLRRNGRGNSSSGCVASRYNSPTAPSPSSAQTLRAVRSAVSAPKGPMSSLANSPRVTTVSSSES